jgi:sorting nexin-8
LSSQNTLPEPSLDLDALQPSTSTFTPPVANYKQNKPPIRSPAPVYSSDDPWNTNPRFGGGPVNNADFGGAQGSLTNGAPSSLSGTGLPKDWWKKQETVNVSILGQQGFILNRYMVYQVSTDVSFFLY